jgi:hypothetical protein
MAIMRQFKPGQLQTGSIYPITASNAVTASYALNANVNTGSLVTTASFNTFTSSYTTGSFTGSFRGDGSQLTGIVSSKWSGSNPISRNSDVEITGSLKVSSGFVSVNDYSNYFVTSLGQEEVGANDLYNNRYAVLDVHGRLVLKTNISASILQNNNVTNSNVVLEFPNKPTGNYTIATTDELLKYNTTSSFTAYTASQALVSQSFNSRINTLTSSVDTLTSSYNSFTSSYTTGSFTGSFRGDGSQLTGIVSSKWTGSNPISRQSDVEITGSLRVQGSITGSLFGTASWANNAVTASYVQTAQTASYVLQAVSASFAISSSRAISSSFATTASYVPAGANNTMVQFNESGSLSGIAGVTINKINRSFQNGNNAIANGGYSHAEGENTIANGKASHAAGYYTITSGSYQSVVGQFNQSISDESAFIIGDGIDDVTRHNLFVAGNGSVAISGSLTVIGSAVNLQTDNFTVSVPSADNILEITDASGVQIASTNGQISADFETRTTRDSANINSIDWDNRQLYQSDGATITLDWETGALTGSLQGTASFASTASYVNTLSQQITLSGSLKLDPTQDPDPTGLDLDSTVLFQSSSNTALGYDLYVRQNGNLVKWKWIEGILETGLLYGGVVTYSGSNVFVSPGSGIIAEHNATTGSEVSPMVEYVTWNAITQSITNIATQQVTYLYIDNTGALQQQSTRFTSQQYHDYIPLGAVGHFDYTQVSAFGGGVQTAYDQISQISNFVDAFGPLKMSGYGLTGQVGSLRLSVGSGTSFIHGGFYQNDPEFPSQITTPSQATASLARVQRSGSVIEFDTNAGNLYTVVDPTKYDRDGDGTLANVGSGNWSIQRVFTDPKTGVLYVYYGQARYSSLLNALQYLPTDPFTEGDTFDFTTFVGFLVLKGNASDITDTAANSIINGGLFRGSGQGSGGGIALSNLDDLTDVSITSPINGQALIYDDAIWKNGTPLSASYAVTASYVETAQTASYVLNAVSASFATSASFAVSASRAVSASFASTASFVTPLNQNVLITGSINITQNITGSRMFLSASSNMNSGSTLTIYGSGSTQPVFTVQGSQGELFSVTDALSGSLFSVNDISGLPILEVFSDNTTLIGNYLDPMLITTAKVTQTTSGSFVMYSLPTASYDTAFFEYSVRSGSNARAGTIMAIQSGSAVNFTETTTTDFGNTSAISFTVLITGSAMALTGSSTTGSWTIKTIVRGL